MDNVRYPGENKHVGFYIVKFMNESHKVLERGFMTIPEARKFVNKLNHSKKCTLISCPSEVYE